jgi:PmbA protein
MVRFSRSSITVVKSTHALRLQAYIGHRGRRIIGESLDLQPHSVRAFLQRLFASCRTLPASADYAALPRGPFRYGGRDNFDVRVGKACDDLVGVTGEAIEAAEREGARSVAGSLTAEQRHIALATSRGARVQGRGTSLLLNVRAFVDRNSSGHGVACSPRLAELKAGVAGSTAGRLAVEARVASRWRPGKYPVILSPTVAADLIQQVGEYTSAFWTLSGVSFLSGLLGKRVAADGFTLHDVPTGTGVFGGRRFDDEGVPTQTTELIRSGRLTHHLHNSTTAQRAKSRTTGNAGIIVPRPWNLIVDAGDHSQTELVSQVREGFLVTNNWYTRFQDLRKGAYSTIPRDAAFFIKGGRIRHAVRGLRLSGTIPNQLRALRAWSRERQWIQWWEVAIPTLAPWCLIDGMTLTQAAA